MSETKRFDVLKVTKYLRFVDVSEDNRKTVTVKVLSTKNGILLGIIKWYVVWRQYAFFPQRWTVWNKDCLLDINQFIVDLMLKRKKHR